MSVREIELSAGTIEYEDTGGDGPTVVLLHGLMMDASLWDGPIADLSVDHRCVAPTLPLGAHRHAMHADADLSLPGIARLVAEFLDRLDLHDVTLVGNDTGGALVQLLICDGAARVGRVVLAACDAFDNFPPGLTGKVLVLTGRLSPRMFGLFMQQMRLRTLRRLPIAFGWLTMRGDAATARWVKPVMKQPGIRRDAVRIVRAAGADTQLMVKAADSLPSCSRKDDWSRSKTATPSSPWTSQRGSLRSSGISPTHPTEPDRHARNKPIRDRRGTDLNRMAVSPAPSEDRRGRQLSRRHGSAFGVGGVDVFHRGVVGDGEQPHEVDGVSGVARLV